jgi:hypothetical protein
MPSIATQVGGTPIPVAAGVADSRIADPFIDALNAYYGHWIKWGHDAKLSNMGGPDKTFLITDACPVANRFPFDPGGWWVRKVQDSKLPVLCIWHRGSKREKQTMVYDVRQRNLGLFYAFPEVLSPRGFAVRSGLMDSIDATIYRATERGSHPTFAHNGSALGALLTATVGATPNTLGWTYDSATIQFEAPRPEIGSGAGGATDYGLEQYGFMTLRGTVTTTERIMQDTLEDPNDVFAGGILAGIKVTGLGDVNDALPYMDRVLSHPDGSEDGDEVI